MNKPNYKLALLFAMALGGVPAISAPQVALVERAPDPHGSPRPARDARDVPVKTSIYFEVGTTKQAEGGDVHPDIVSARLQEQGDGAVELLQPGQRFADDASGWLRPKRDLQGAKSLAVYIELPRSLKPATTYTVIVSSGSTKPKERSAVAGTWSFTTESMEPVPAQEFLLDLKSAPTVWHGRFFSGVCNVIFCTQAANYGPTFDLMAEARKQHPNAWSLQRDFWLTGTEFRPPGLLPVNLPNIVRERETRRIAAIEPRAGGVLLRLEDVVGSDQYGIPGGRPVGEDFHKDDEVLIADGIHDARSKVVSANTAARTVTLTSLTTPPGDWKIAYEGPLPNREDPDAPGLFAPGGCYLRKLNPHGTACYYWGRLDKEWDLSVRHYGRRVVANFADAPGDLSRDGRSWTTVKDYVQWHEVARAIAEHVIDRFGASVSTLPGASSTSPTWGRFSGEPTGPSSRRSTTTRPTRFCGRSRIGNIHRKRFLSVDWSWAGSLART